MPGRLGDISGKDGMFDNSLLFDDFLDFIPNPYDSMDTFPITDPETSGFGGNSSTNIAINYNELMVDLVNIMSLDKALADNDASTNKPLNDLPESTSQNERKRVPDEEFDSFWLLSSLPDHNYSSPAQKRQKIDDGPIPNDNSATDSSVGDEDDQQPVVTKSVKYMERRKKNNVASKRSREIRKTRFQEMEVQANQLEEENEKLRQRIEKLEKFTQQMKDVLVNKLSNGR